MKHITRILQEIREELKENNENNLILDLDEILELLMDPKDDLILKPFDVITKKYKTMLQKEQHDKKDLKIVLIKDIIKIKSILDLIIKNKDSITINKIATVKAVCTLFEEAICGE